MSDNIPFDLQVEIMKRLPVKSLIQFRSVSKPWRYVINSSKFINNYHHTQQQHHLLVSFGHPETYISIADNDTFPHQKLRVPVPLSLNMPNLLSLNIPIGKLFVGSSQGLFCFIDLYSDRAVIWNPSIRKSVTISLPNYLYPPYETYDAFGVCPGTCDPKLVKATQNCNLGGGDYIVEVFSLSTKAWKTLTTNLPRNSIEFTGNQVVIDRFIYWLAFDEEYRLIMLFDMITDEFKQLNLPDTLALDTDVFISKMRESLVVVQMRSEDEKPVASVWMMDDNDPKLFTKQFIIKTPNGINEVREFRRNGEPIIDMVEEDDPNNVDLFVYESDSEHVNRIGITVPRYSCEVSSYTETLLLLDH